MGSQRKRPAHESAKAKKRQLLNTAQERAVFSIRRRLDPEYLWLFEEVTERLTENIQSYEGSVSKAKSLGMTVVGFTRFTEKHINDGPKTCDVVKKVSSLNFPLYAQLGGLGLYGGLETGRRKLGIEIVSTLPSTEDFKYETTAFQEIIECERAFKEEGFPLNPDPHSKHIVPHVSMAFLFADMSVNFCPDRTERLDEIEELLQIKGDIVKFLPYIPPQYSASIRGQ